MRPALVVAMSLSAALALAARGSSLPHGTVPLESGLLLHAGFDGSVTADLSLGSPEPSVQGQPRFVEGRRAQAVVVGRDNWLSYAAGSNVNPPQGTIEFWLQPLDWDGTDGEKSHFFVGAAGRDRLYVYKFARWRHFTFHLNPASADYYESLRAPIYQWERGQWHHAVVTWDRVRMCIYLDGELVADAHIPAPLEDLGESLFVGKELATPQFAEGETAIDELYVYSRPLFPEEVARAYRRIVDESEGIQHEPFTEAAIYYTGYATQRRAELSFVLSFAAPPDGTAELLVTEVASGEEMLRLPLRIGPAGTLADREIDTGRFEPAEYDITVRVSDAAGKPLFEGVKRLTIRDRWWQTAHAGRPRDVPPPWSRLVRRRNTISCWGRTYTLDNETSFAQITSAGEDLLSQPMRLVAVAGGKELGTVHAWRSVAFSEINAYRESTLGSGDLRIKQGATFDFDGFVRLSYTVTPPAGGAVLDRLSFEIPLRPEVAKYLHTTSQRARYYYCGDIREGNWPAQQVYHVWLGDEDRGISFILEGSGNWPNQDETRQLIVEVGEEANVLRANLIAEPTELTQPLEFSFGIQATPVRPMPEGWRRTWRMSPQTGTDPDPQLAEDYSANVAVIWWSERPDTPRWFAFPEPSDPEAFRRLVEDYHARGIKVLVYQNLTNLSPNVPEFAEYSGEWFAGPKPVPLLGPDEAPPPERWQHVRLTRRDWADFIIAHQARVIDEYDVDGWYFDCSTPYEMDGIHPVFDYRELCKRAYVALKTRKPDGLIITHTSSSFMAPALAFSDAYLEGEQFRWALPEYQVADDYTKVLTLDYVRAELTGRQLGCVPVFLPEFPGAGHRTRRNTEHLLALTRLHDINVWPIWCDPKPVRELWQALDRFGVGEGDVQFLPYWEQPPAAATHAGEVLVSAYRRPGQALLVVSNFLGHEDQTVGVVPDLERLGIQGDFTPTDLLSQEPVPMENQTLIVELPEGRARFVRLAQR